MFLQNNYLTIISFFCIKYLVLRFKEKKMNAEKISDREEVLKIVNEDWPMLEELGKKRFVINKKQKTNKNLLQKPVRRQW